ncbi:MAG: hypothetical protein JHC73_05570 [Dolichospermum sp.]|nr:hypothetical protein [Dolichospermum sp.]
MQTKKNDSAFPIFDSSGEHFIKHGGLSKREFFAAMALQGILANPEFMATMAPSFAVRKADELIYLLNETNDGE